MAGSADVRPRGGQLRDVWAVIHSTCALGGANRLLTDGGWRLEELCATVDGLGWPEAVIPDALPPVRVQRLHIDPVTKAFTVLVRFPGGWQRPHAGHYLVDEEVIFLQGSFEMSGIHYTAGSYGYFPAGYLRDGSASPGGALALAWFSGRQQWVRGPDVRAVPAPITVPNWRALRPARPPAAGSDTGRLLRHDVSGDSWVLDRPLSGRSPADGVVELFSLVDHTWARVSPGEALPNLPAPIFCRFRNNAA
jgi:hypothetical protein